MSAFSESRISPFRFSTSIAWLDGKGKDFGHGETVELVDEAASGLDLVDSVNLYLRKFAAIYPYTHS